MNYCLRKSLPFGGSLFSATAGSLLSATAGSLLSDMGGSLSPLLSVNSR